MVAWQDILWEDSQPLSKVLWEPSPPDWLGICAGNTNYCHHGHRGKHAWKKITTHVYLRFWTRFPWKLLVGRKILNQEQLLLCASVATYNCKSTSVFTSWIVDRIDHWSTPSSSNMMCLHIHWIEWCCKSTQDLVTLISKLRGSSGFAFCFPS